MRSASPADDATFAFARLDASSLKATRAFTTELAFGIISTESATGLRLGFEPFLEKLSAQEAFGRPAEVWEVANVMMFLASDLSSYMTGEIVSVSSQHA